MKYYLYYELGKEDPIFISEEDILQQYWACWEERMIKKYGTCSDLITEANCIDDWVIVNWAWEDK